MSMNVDLQCPVCKRTRTIYFDHVRRTVTYACNGGCES